MHETIEGEVIVIDLETGSYYSLRDASADIWQGIQSGADEQQIAIAIVNARGLEQVRFGQFVRRGQVLREIQVKRDKRDDTPLDIAEIMGKAKLLPTTT